MYHNIKYINNKRLNKYEFKAFSQNGEDGIIEEIFNRIGTTNHFFVEFGVAEGIETNTTYLLYKGWKGYWIEGDEKRFNLIRNFFGNVISSKQLRVTCDFITAENIESLFEKANVPVELDILSIDIDGNDYHVWNAIKSYHPRVVVIEYNAIFRPGCDFVIPYDAHAMWDETSNFGASIESLYKLGLQKGYTLVACCFAGVNAFFVRNDLIGNNFESPFTSEHHYEPPRYFLSLQQEGHPRRVTL